MVSTMYVSSHHDKGTLTFTATDNKILRCSTKSTPNYIIALLVSPESSNDSSSVYINQLDLPLREIYQHVL